MNCMRDHFRRRDAESRALARLEQERPASWSGEAEGQISDRDEVMRALEELSDQERDDIALRYGAGLAVPEIADLLGQPLTTVESRFYRALRKLRDRLPPQGQ